MSEVLGIDYNTKEVHVAVLDASRNLAVSKFPVAETLYQTIERLADLFELADLPNSIAFVEAPIYIQNPRTSFKLTRVHILICAACERAGLQYRVIEPTRWKKITLGNARAKKEEVIQAMREIWGETISDSHFADATAMAIAGQKILLEETKND